MHLDRLLRAIVQFKASDLHVQTGSPPTLRINNDLTALDLPVVTAEDVPGFMADVATERTKREIETQLSEILPTLFPTSGDFASIYFTSEANSPSSRATSPCTFHCSRNCICPK